MRLAFICPIHLWPALLGLLLVPSLVSGGRLEGVVVDGIGRPLQGVQVELIGSGQLAFTDSRGHYRFETPWENIPQVPRQPAHKTLIPAALGKGLPIENLRERNALGREQTTGRPGAALRPDFRDFSGANRVRGFIPRDSLLFTLRGYRNLVLDVASAGRQKAAVLTPGTAFEQIRVGNGWIPDLSSGEARFVPKSNRIHVVLFPDGYTHREMALGRYDADIESWITEVFSLDILNQFRNAFVIWAFPATSTGHAGGYGSRFAIPVKEGGVGHGFRSLADSLWSAMESFPFAPKEAVPRLGSRRVVCSFLIYKPDAGQAGYSGRAFTLRHPDGSGRLLNVALGRDHHHEFIHALANLRDEYHNRDQKPLGPVSLVERSRHISNVVSSNHCDDLPWKHLLHGGLHNPGVDSLVGAFGVDGRFHSELKCLLNGAHHNRDIYGGSSQLRSQDRMCNWCRELTAFRIWERTQEQEDTRDSWLDWKSGQRNGFYSRFGFVKPATVPQTNSLGREYYFPCR